MKLFLDTSIQSEIEKWKHYVEGVTSNPILLNKADITPEKFFLNNKESFKNIFIQIQEVEQIFDSNSDVIYKIPFILDNMNLIRHIKNIKLSGEKIRVCATTVYDSFQFNEACKMECDFCIVLCYKNPDDQFLQKCSYIKKRYNYKTEIIAASFRTKKDVEDALLSGADYATIPPKVLEECFCNKNSLNDCREYNECNSVL